MTEYVHNLQARLNKELDEIEKMADNSLQASAESMTAVQQAMRELKGFVLSHSFTDQQEEVMFFQQHKPFFQSRLVYFQMVFQIESAKPFGITDSQREYFIGHQKRSADFIESHKEFYNYHRSGSRELDILYYTRNGAAEKENEMDADLDRRYCTPMGQLLATVIAIEELNEYLQSELHKLDGRPSAQFRSPLVWTMSKIDAIEFGYALFAAKVFNNGNATLKQIFAVIEVMCNVKVGNYYSGFLKNIRLRKKEQVVFIRRLDSSLVEYIDELLENPKYS